MLSPVGGKALSTIRRMSLEASHVPQTIIPINTYKEKMFDQLLIIGCSPEKNSDQKPVILTMFPSTDYPQSDHDFDYIIQMCFPNGFKEVTNSSNNVIINEFAFFLDSLTPTQSKNTSDNENDRIYAIVVQFSSPKEFTPYFVSTSNRRFPFCICVLSHKPFLSSHFQFTLYVALLLTGRAPASKSGKRIPLPVRGFCHPSLTLDKKMPAIAVFPGISAPVHLLDVLSFYLTRPTEPQSTPYVDIPYFSRIPMTVPLNMSVMQCISHPTVDLLFSCFTPAQVVRIYSAVLLEKRVAFVSRDPHNSSLCVAATMSFMRPFKISARFVPVLDATRSCAELPSGIVCGVYVSSGGDDVSMKAVLADFDVIAVINDTFARDDSDEELKIESSEYSTSSDAFESTFEKSSFVLSRIFAALDSGRNAVIFDSQLQRIPQADEIVRKLELVIRNRWSQAKIPPKTSKSFFGKESVNTQFDSFLDNIVEPFSFPPFYFAIYPQKFCFPAVLVDSIREIFASHFPIELNLRIKQAFAGDSFSSDKFIESFRMEDRQFVAQFAKTSTFNDFLQRIIRQFNRNKNEQQLVQPISNKNSIKSPTAVFSPFTKDD